MRNDMPLSLSPQTTYHLGNIREVVDAKGVVQQVTNYYPFGAPYADATASKGAAVQPYKYNGKELDLMHGLNTYDYGARQHDLSSQDGIELIRCARSIIAQVRIIIA